jgi:pimeloyl-ACP methyl ester carboxylesterase
MKNIIGWLFFLILFESCNFYSIHIRKEERQFNRAGIIHHVEVFNDTLSTSESEQIGVKSVFITENMRYNSEKPTLLLIHGYQGGAIGQWWNNVSKLTRNFNIICPDLNYHGSTYFASDFSIEMQVDLVHEMLDFTASSWAHENLILIGSSYGGLVASRFAEKYAGQVKALVIYDGLSNCFNPAFTDSVAQSIGMSNAIKLLNPSNGNELRTLMSLDAPIKAPQFIFDQIAEFHFKRNRSEKIQLLEYLNRNEKEFNGHYFDWKCPVYLLWGQRDKIIPLESARCLSKKYSIPEDRIFVYPEIGHVLNIQDHKAFNKWVIDTFSN